VASQLPPSTSIAWKSDIVQSMLGGIVRLEYDRGAGVGSNTEAGVATLIREETGGHTIEAGVVTVAPANPAKRHLTRTLMGIFIVASLRRSLRPYIDAPNVRATWDQIYPPVKAFLDSLKRNSQNDAVALLPHIVNYGLGTPESANSAAEIKAGDLKVPLQVELSPGIERLVFLIQYGQTVSITLQN
jgi:phage tail sheath protein FI